MFSIFTCNNTNVNEKLNSQDPQFYINNNFELFKISETVFSVDWWRWTNYNKTQPFDEERLSWVIWMGKDKSTLA